jgi:glutathione synthase/RimK-type ligase-like ATP-grasp enzyme
MTTNDLTDVTPTPLTGLAKLMRMALSGKDLGPLGAQMIERAETDPSANTLMDLSTVLQLRGNRDLALLMQAEAIGSQQIYAPPTASGQVNIRVCAVMSAGDLMANTPLEFLLEDSDVALNLVYVTANQPLPAQLPDHDVLFVAIAQSDQNTPLLKELASAMTSWPRPVLNQPDRIALLSRERVCELLKPVPEVMMPVTVRMNRQILEDISHRVVPLSSYLEGGAYPIIVRPVDSHAGQGLDKIVDAEALTNYLQIRPDREFYVSQFVDYRGHDELFRKYRIVLIEGRPFICHLGISEHWMIHYLNAGMAESAGKRAEEAAVMTVFDTDFATKHAEAFRSINERMGLDYLGIDCGETPDGQLLIFEVDSCMIVHALDPVELFPYKQPQMRKVFAAFRQMLLNAMQRNVS